MKKQTKIILLTSAALIVIGSIMAGLAWFFTGGKLGVYKNSTGWHKAHDISMVNQEETLEPFENITLNLNSMPVYFVASDSFKITLQYPNNQTVNYTNQDNTLTVTSNESEVQDSYLDFFSFNATQKQTFVNIYYPKGTNFKNIDMQLQYGAFNAQALKGENIAITQGYGDILINNVEANELKTNATHGYISLNQVTSNALTCKAGYGSVQIENAQINQQLTASSNNGSIELDNIKSDVASLNSVYGSIEVESSVFNTLELNNKNGGIYLEGTVEQSCQFKNTYGQTTLNLKGIPDDYNIDLTARFGDINIDGQTYEHSLQKDRGEEKKIVGENNNGDINITFG